MKGSQILWTVRFPPVGNFWWIWPCAARSAPAFAPRLWGQANVRNVTTSLINGRLADEATLSPTDPIARQKGGKELEPEKSVNYSVGTVFSLGRLDVTLDYYRIKLQDRIGLTKTLTLTESDIATLLARGVADASSFTGVRYFTNDFDTTTQGIDLVATYPLETFAGSTRFTFVGNWNKTQVDSRNPAIIDDGRVRQLEDNLPEFRFSLTSDHTYGPWRLLTRLHFYDGFYAALSAGFAYRGRRTLACGRGTLVHVYEPAVHGDANPRVRRREPVRSVPGQKPVCTPRRRKISGLVTLRVQRWILLPASRIRVLSSGGAGIFLAKEIVAREGRWIDSNAP